MNKKFLYILLAFIFITVNVSAQLENSSDEYATRNAGFSFTMAEAGSGLGGFYDWPILTDTHLGVSLGAYFLRDKNQISYQDYYGYYYEYGKENNVYLFDFMVSLKRRFFASDLDKSLRPFLVGGIGPYYGMNYPEYDTDLAGNLTKDEFAWALGGYVGAGVDIDASANFYLGIRFNYRVIPFTERIGERKNHSMIELRFEIGNRY